MPGSNDLCGDSHHSIRSSQMKAHIISSPHYNLKQAFSPYPLLNPSLEKEGCQPKSIYKDIFDLRKNMSFYIKYFEILPLIEKSKFLQNIYFST